MAHAGSVGWDGMGSLRSLRAVVQAAVRDGIDASPVPPAIRYAIIIASDGVASIVALVVALWLRFDGEIPAGYARLIPAAAGTLVVVRLACNASARLHRWSFRLAGLAEGIRVAAAAVAGTVLFVAASWVLGLHLPRTVYALELFLSATAFGVVRFLPRAAFRWAGMWSQTLAGAPRALIIGAGHATELLARDLRRASEAQYQLVGFIDENPHMVRCRIDGIPILGGIHDLPMLIRRHRIAVILLADPRMPAARIREVVALCARSRVRFKITPASWAHLERRLSGAMLEDMSPEDLMPRAAIAFDELEIRRLVAGRRALVTGAGGSIGGELARQLARNGVRQLVMVDMNENELYLRRLALAEDHPEVDIRCEVADVREPEPLRRLGERYRPQDVFHAAAHKHVPLMEDAPAEAVKNNVFGTMNAARMADECGAERFVLISTDKAVNPTSVMGATKRVAELIVRNIARRSGMRVTAVRFGNVLGSSGSIIPIFKHQIARGGPVTVTHPDCMRYFMTIPEAVGLVLLAGLGGHGELCVLDMGEPVRIADIAGSMITLSGHVPGEDVEIVYTGLRPGEKLNEEVLTEQEERSLVVRDGIRVTQSPPPPHDLDARLEELRRFANDGNREAILAALRSLVPTYCARPGLQDEQGSPYTTRKHGPRERIAGAGWPATL
ncbi:polysaccharide biosynthesis protein [Anaeromyxobacter terrae]|uniref:polysaccharide biosynthesis protein n=1 Tax=Anaeromyxobacter terrae TaxID=2925406 RepID=UPI001F595D85|nr:nucleoside-diphosphate sugar epimerase/dehydratase [Anaeromyxobacter sp. SG22]